VRVKHGLSGQGAAVHADVECPHRRIGIENPLLDVFNQPVYGPHFAIMQVEIVGHVHQTLRVTLAMEADVANHAWSIEENRIAQIGRGSPIGSSISGIQ
jgi:hypothetical protein